MPDRPAPLAVWCFGRLAGALTLLYLPESRQAVLAPAYDVLSTFAYRKTHNLPRKTGAIRPR